MLDGERTKMPSLSSCKNEYKKVHLDGPPASSSFFSQLRTKFNADTNAFHDMAPQGTNGFLVSNFSA